MIAYQELIFVSVETAAGLPDTVERKSTGAQKQRLLARGVGLERGRSGLKRGKLVARRGVETAVGDSGKHLGFEPDALGRERLENRGGTLDLVLVDAETLLVPGAGLAEFALLKQSIALLLLSRVECKSEAAKAPVKRRSELCCGEIMDMQDGHRQGQAVRWKILTEVNLTFCWQDWISCILVATAADMCLLLQR